MDDPTLRAVDRRVREPEQMLSDPRRQNFLSVSCRAAAPEIRTPSGPVRRLCAMLEAARSNFGRFMSIVRKAERRG